MIILDTNILSALMQQAPEVRVIEWLDRQPRLSVWTTAVSVLEVRFGLQIMPLGKRRSHLAEQFESLLEKFEQRIASFDIAAAHETSELMAKRRKSGRIVDIRDAMIAGISLVHHAALATRNISDFADTRVPLVNPWSA